MEKKSNVGLYIIIIILCIALTVAVCYIVFKKDNGPVQQIDDQNNITDNNNNQNNNDNNKTNPPAPKIESYLIEENDKSHDVTYVKVDTTDYSQKNCDYGDGNGKVACETYRYDIYYKNIKVYSINPGYVSGIGDIYQIGDVIMYTSVGSGATSSIEIIDKHGNNLMSYYEFDDGMGINGIRAYKNIKVEGDTIIIPVSQYGSPCGLDVNLASATYQLKYLGNNQFSDLEMISKETKEEACANLQ